jgi:dynein heavy chain
MITRCHQATLTKQQNDYKIMLKQLEDELLARLTAAEDNILEDEEVVINLENTKKMSEEVAAKVVEGKETAKKIDVAREVYRPAATRASLLYFILNDLNTINPIYQFSLKVMHLFFFFQPLQLS